MKQRNINKQQAQKLPYKSDHKIQSLKCLEHPCSYGDERVTLYSNRINKTYVYLGKQALR